MQKKIKEFEKAKELIELMSSVSNLEEYEEYWKEFLHNLDRGFNKLKDLYKNDKRAKRVIDAINTARNSDPLIAYLMQARNSDEHSMRQITDKAGGYTKITGGLGGGKIIRGILEGGKAPDNLVIEGNFDIEFKIDSLHIISVINCGKKFDPPKICAGKDISTETPHIIAAIGLDFYLEKISQIEIAISTS
ncbi:hypothetical protein [Polynucleobacter sp. AP-Nino-20-G2]|uniref:hypothetical protein n=1 Tax=Polynucleobacter sp. AP-Nino-20-G2 TaxID=2576917 RepID=UPI001BFE9893|nr:hypothetical protein [Polynucleobacter sp. AP-Nino-20-G2]QWE16293.1 hypothetical protein FD960_08405 [Polynucleobacter sp. AP-Nino-20-G2]